MVAGASMEPTVHQGDLAIVRESQTYSVGDVATYIHPTVGPVVHRIVCRQGNRFVFRGDANDWLDSYAPAPAEIVGKSWLVIPGGALILSRLRTPAGLALLSIAFAVLLVVTFRKGRSERPKPMKARPTSLPAAGAKRLEVLDGPIFVLAALALGALILAIVAFSRPVEIASE